MWLALEVDVKTASIVLWWLSCRYRQHQQRRNSACGTTEGTCFTSIGEPSSSFVSMRKRLIGFQTAQGSSTSTAAKVELPVNSQIATARQESTAPIRAQEQPRPSYRLPTEAGSRNLSRRELPAEDIGPAPHRNNTCQQTGGVEMNEKLMFLRQAAALRVTGGRIDCTIPVTRRAARSGSTVGQFSVTGS